MAGTPSSSSSGEASKSPSTPFGKQKRTRPPRVISAAAPQRPQRKAERSRSGLPAPKLKLITGRVPWMRPFTVMTIMCWALK